MVRRGGGGGGDDDDDDHDNNNRQQQLELLRHWIEELDGFERRICDLRDSLCCGDDILTQKIGDSEMGFLLQDLDGLDWMTDADADADDNGGDELGDAYSSSLYETLLDLHDYFKALDARIIAATEARASLASLSASDSARTALYRTRQLLLDAAAIPQQRDLDNNYNNVSRRTTTVSSAKSRVVTATKQAHKMLNLVEDTLLECANFLDDDE